MTFGWTRNFQRYEYVVISGYVTGKTCYDVGCGIGQGTAFLGAFAKKVIGIDKKLLFTPGPMGFPIAAILPPNATLDVTVYEGDIHDVYNKMDVCVAIEVFEHIEDPKRFVKKLATLCDYLFITTPLVAVTYKTNNPAHVLEYSKEDFQSIVGEHFNILDRVYQEADLRIVTVPEPKGCSMDDNHVVQMLWCERNDI